MSENLKHKHLYKLLEDLERSDETVEAEPAFSLLIQLSEAVARSVAMLLGVDAAEVACPARASSVERALDFCIVNTHRCLLSM